MRFLFPLVLLAATALADPAGGPAPWSARLIGVITCKDIVESSGIIASRKHPGVYWTHNDSGSPAVLYAMDRTGRCVGIFPIDAPNTDWEDIAIDDAGRLYIADIGNNAATRKQIAIHQIDEPDPAAGGKKPAPLKARKTWRLAYPAEPFDSEAFFVWDGHGYLISKLLTGTPAGVYRFALNAKADPVMLERVTSLPIRSPVTAADISADGKRLAVLSILGLNVFEIGGDIAAAGKAKPQYTRLIHPNIEACCFVPDGVLVTSEKRQIYLIGDHPPDEAAAAPMRLAIPRLDKPVVIDGDLGEWSDSAGRLPLRFHSEEVPAAEPPAAQAWARWHEDGLYVAGTLTSPNLGPLLRAWFFGDTVEFFLGRESPDRSPEYEVGDNRCYIGFSRNADGKAGGLELHWPRHRDTPTPDAKAAGRINGDGTWQFELYWPMRLAADEQVRFNISMLTHRPRHNWFLSSSNDDGCWVSPLKSAVVRLAR